jgi:predicted GIY-YIG superfamily endonuclease
MTTGKKWLRIHFTRPWKRPKNNPTSGRCNMKERQPAIYIMTNRRNGTLYVGVTSNLVNRVYQHKQELQSGFTKQYDCTKLVYYELGEDMLMTIAREKQIKGGSRKKKLALIERMNPRWLDLYETLL